MKRKFDLFDALFTPTVQDVDRFYDFRVVTAYFNGIWTPYEALQIARANHPKHHLISYHTKEYSFELVFARKMTFIQYLLTIFG